MGDRNHARLRFRRDGQHAGLPVNGSVHVHQQRDSLVNTRASVATRVIAAGLFEAVPVDTTRLDHDPVTLAQNGLLLEESRTHLLRQLSSWVQFGVVHTPSTDFAFFDDGTPVFLIT